MVVNGEPVTAGILMMEVGSGSASLFSFLYISVPALSKPLERGRGAVPVRKAKIIILRF